MVILQNVSIIPKQLLPEEVHYFVVKCTLCRFSKQIGNSSEVVRVSNLQVIEVICV